VNDDRRAVVIGGSAGGMAALLQILEPLPNDHRLIVLVAHHLHKDDGGRFANHLDSHLAMSVEEAYDKAEPERGRAYVAPADYHLLVEADGTLALSVDPKIRWARPSIDVLFESAARAWSEALVGVILSGANDDGARGMKEIRKFGGLCIAQDPETAESPTMPRAAIEAAEITNILAPPEIGEALVELSLRKPLAPEADSDRKAET